VPRAFKGHRVITKFNSPIVSSIPRAFLGGDKRFGNIDSALVAMENGTHSIWVSEQIKELGHEVIVGNVRELRAISHSDRKSDKVDAEKIARYARVDPEILRPIAHRTVAQQETAMDTSANSWSNAPITSSDLAVKTLPCASGG
jgi:transposase